MSRPRTMMINKKQNYTPVAELNNEEEENDDDRRRSTKTTSRFSSSFQRLFLISAGLLLTTVLLVWIFPRKSSQKPRLFLDPSKKSFKILQLTDLHLGERPDTLWGPQQDVKTYKAIKSILSYESTNLDLIVLSGDVLSAQNVDTNATLYYHELAQFLESYQIPHALVFGNHDDADYEEEEERQMNTSEIIINKRPAKTTRQQLATTMMQYPHSLTQMGPSNIFGTSNYVLPIYYKSAATTYILAAQVVLLDTGGGSLPNQLDQSQVDWFQQQIKANTPTFIFQHIPMKQFLYNSTLCHVGRNGDGGIDPLLDANDAMYNTYYTNSNVQFVAVGHNHGNDYVCHAMNTTTSSQKLHLIFGRHSGYGGYEGGGGWTNRGARVFELMYTSGDTTTSITGWKTYVRNEDGSIIDSYETGV